MKDTPILFRAPMVVALLAGTKTQTRRVIKAKLRDHGCVTGDCPHENRLECAATLAAISPYGAPGDTLYVRESLRQVQHQWYYASDGKPVVPRAAGRDAMERWMRHQVRPACPSIHMPRWASRIQLELTAVRAEPVEQITEADAYAEGFVPDPERGRTMAKHAFLDLFYAANPTVKRGSNPNVWVLTFARVP